MHLPSEAEANADAASMVAVSPLGVRVNEAVRRAAEIKLRRETIEAEFKTLGHELEGLVRYTIPELLAQIGTSVWDTEEASVKMGVKVLGTLNNAPDEAAAVEYLREHEFPGTVKTVLSIEFSEEERAMCAALAQSIVKATGKDASYARAVNAATLQSWGRTRLSDGEPTDFSKVGLRSWREAALTIKP